MNQHAIAHLIGTVALGSSAAALVQYYVPLEPPFKGWAMAAIGFATLWRVGVITGIL